MVGDCMEWLHNPVFLAQRIRNNARYQVAVHVDRTIDFRNFVGFLPPRIYGYPGAEAA